jgi:hypothetical protein
MARREDGPGPTRPVEAVPPVAAEDPTWEGLEDQFRWYDRKSAATASAATSGSSCSSLRLPRRCRSWPAWAAPSG